MKNEPGAEYLRMLPHSILVQTVAERDRVIYTKFFNIRTAWYVAGYDDGARSFFCYQIKDDEPESADWVRIGIDILGLIPQDEEEVERDMMWLPRRASRVDEIVEAYRAQDRLSVLGIVEEEAAENE